MKSIDDLKSCESELMMVLAALISACDRQQVSLLGVDEELELAKNILGDVLRAQEKPTLQYVIVRSKVHGVSAGYLQSVHGNVVRILEARRIWFWKKAATLSELATTGPKDIVNCKFPIAVDWQWINNWAEIIPCTQKARDVIQSVPEWRA